MAFRHFINAPKTISANNQSETSDHGMEFTAILYVHPDGNNSDGKSWVNAYTTLNAALDAADTDANCFTLINLGSANTEWDINVTGDPTWAANVFIDGAQRPNTTIKNTHASATSVLKLTGTAKLNRVVFDCETGNHGFICTGSSVSLIEVFINGSALTSAKTLCDVQSVSSFSATKCNFLGDLTKTYATGLKITSLTFATLRLNDFWFGLKALDLYTCTYVLFNGSHFTQCAIAITIDSNCVFTFFFHTELIQNTINIVDAGTGSFFDSTELDRESVVLLPLTASVGTTITGAAGADAYGAWIEIDDGSTFTKPFKIVAIYVSETSDANTNYILELGFGAGGSELSIDTFLFFGANKGSDETDIKSGILPAGTRLAARTMTGNGGSDTVDIWIGYVEF